MSDTSNNEGKVRLPDAGDYQKLVDEAYELLMEDIKTYHPTSVQIARRVSDVLEALAHEVQKQTSNFFIDRELQQARESSLATLATMDAMIEFLSKKGEL